MKVVTWNLNGYRSVERKDKLKQIYDLNPDFILFQELKMNEELIENSNYNIYYNFATRRKGYSGVAILSKEKPLRIETKIGHEEFDSEGRFLLLEFKDLIVINLYAVNGSRDVNALPYKLKTMDLLLDKFKFLKEKKVIIGTDFNIAHEEIDVKNYKNNYNSIMFTKEERQKVTELLNIGYEDVFRKHNKESGTYSWWSYMFNARENNAGWRIDYFFVSKNFYNESFKVNYLMDYLGSDHCPLLLEYKEKEF